VEVWINPVQQREAVRMSISSASGLTQAYSESIAANLCSEAFVEKVLSEYLRN